MFSRKEMVLDAQACVGGDACHGHSGSLEVLVPGGGGWGSPGALALLGWEGGSWPGASAKLAVGPAPSPDASVCCDLCHQPG